MGEVLEPPQLAERIAELKRVGRIIAFANGHFDMLHVGHLRYLQGARDEGDVLVVDTVGIAPARDGNGGGVASSAARHVIERFSLSEDGGRAIVDVRIEDPEYLAEPFTGRTEMTYVPHLQLYRYDCSTE